MKKGVNVLGLVILGLFMFSVLASVVSAATPLQQLTSFINSLSVHFVGIGFAKVLLFLLVLLLVYSVATFVPVIKDQKDWVKFGISAIVAWLSIMYLVSEEVYSILLSYQTLGIVLTTFLPFAIMLVFTIRWNIETPEYFWVSSALWIAFAVVLTMKYVMGVFDWWTGQPSSIGLFGILAYLFTFVACLVLAWRGQALSMWFMTKELMGSVAKFKGMEQIEIASEINRLRDLLRSTPEQFRPVIQTRIKELDNLMKERK